MRIEEILSQDFSPRVSVHLDAVKKDDKDEVAGMLRGLMCSIEGWSSISGLTNDKFAAKSPVVLSFSSVENAHYFKSCVDYFFSDEILARLRVTKRVYRVL